MNKKCPNCLCMVEKSAKVCNFCKTPLAVIADSVVKSNFMPPVISAQEVVKPVISPVIISPRAELRNTIVNKVQSEELDLTEINNQIESFELTENRLEIDTNLDNRIKDILKDNKTYIEPFEEKGLESEDIVIPDIINQLKNDSEFVPNLETDEVINPLKQNLNMQQRIERLESNSDVQVSEQERKMLTKIYDLIASGKEIPDPLQMQFDNYEANLDVLGFVEDELDFKELKKHIDTNQIEPVESVKPNDFIMPPHPVFNQSFLEIPDKKDDDVIEQMIGNIENIVVEDTPIRQKEIKPLDLKSRVKRIGDRLSSEDPFLREPFEIDSLEIAEIKDEIPEQYHEEEVKASSIDIDPDSMKELNDLAMLISPVIEEIKTETVEEIETEEKVVNRFDTKDVIRVSNENIIEKDTPAPPTRNIREAVSALQNLQYELEQNTPVLDYSQLDKINEENKVKENDDAKLEDLFNIIPAKEIESEKEKVPELDELETLAFNDKDANSKEQYPIDKDSEETFSLPFIDLSSIVDGIQDEINEIPETNPENKETEIKPVFSNRLKHFAKTDNEHIDSENYFSLEDLDSPLEITIPDFVVELEKEIEDKINFQEIVEENTESYELPHQDNLIENKTDEYSNSIEQTLLNELSDENLEEITFDNDIAYPPLLITQLLQQQSEEKENTDTKISNLLDENIENIVSESFEEKETKEQEDLDNIINPEIDEIIIPEGVINENNAVSVLKNIEDKNINSNAVVDLRDFSLHKQKDYEIQIPEKIEIEQDKEYETEKDLPKEETGLVRYIKPENPVPPPPPVEKNKSVPLVTSNHTSQNHGARSTNNIVAMSHYNIARDMCVKREYEKALEELEKAVKIDPAFEQAHILLSRTYLKLKNTY